jgi:hypothetical protein
VGAVREGMTGESEEVYVPFLDRLVEMVATALRDTFTTVDDDKRHLS